MLLQIWHWPRLLTSQFVDWSQKRLQFCWNIHENDVLKHFKQLSYTNISFQGQLLDVFFSRQDILKQNSEVGTVCPLACLNGISTLSLYAPSSVWPPNLKQAPLLTLSIFCLMYIECSLTCPHCAHWYSHPDLWRSHISQHHISISLLGIALLQDFSLLNTFKNESLEYYICSCGLNHEPVKRTSSQ